MNDKYYAVIMAGGIGSRFWPYSRNAKPKQFLDVMGIGKSLLQLTYERFKNICPEENILIVTNERYGDLVKEQIEGIKDDQILLEPLRRNTAPCIAYACYKIAEKDPDASIVVAPSDHAIFNESKFFSVINIALEAASTSDILITLGIKPSRPETGYGYIQFIESNEDVKKVKTFTEKPQYELAKKFVDSGEFVWNAGIFIWNVKAIKKAFEKKLPEISEIFSEISESYYTDNEQTVVNEAYYQCKNISIDYGILEKVKNVHVVLADFDWSDLGSWNSLYDISDKDSNGNVIDGNAILYDSKNCIIKGPKDKIIVVEGLSEYLVADHGNALLICNKNHEKKFREFFNDVKNKKGEEFM